jgi:hypothetical protein
LDFSRLRPGEIIASLGGLALFVFLFLDWLGEEGSDVGLSGWDYLGVDVTGFIVFLASGIALFLGVSAALGRRNPLFSLPWGGPTTVLGVLAFDIVLWRLFTVPDGSQVQFGLFLGLVSAAAIAVGGYRTLQEGGSDPLGIGGVAPATTRRIIRKPAAKPKPAAKRKPAARRRSAR